MQRVGLIHHAKFPIDKYGGTERVVWWLAHGLAEEGILVTLVGAPGTQCSFADVIESDFKGNWWKEIPECDVLHFFTAPPSEPDVPYISTVGGNGKPGETFLTNTVFVSKNHAERHGSQSFVYNGVKPDEYEFSAVKEDYLFFLAKASWKVKNVDGAIRVARQAGRKLRIMGGSRPWLPSWRGVRWEGNVGGKKKAEIVSRGAALLFPVIWHEPFGIAVIEALMSGSPVIGTRRGSLPELLPTNVGAICDTEEELVGAIRGLSKYRASDCRDWAMTRFHYRQMTRDYLEKYKIVVGGRKLNNVPPRSIGNPGAILPL